MHKYGVLSLIIMPKQYSGKSVDNVKFGSANYMRLQTKYAGGMLCHFNKISKDAHGQAINGYAQRSTNLNKEQNYNNYTADFATCKT